LLRASTIFIVSVAPAFGELKIINPVFGSRMEAVKPTL
jgi:hypothetical protein